MYQLSDGNTSILLEQGNSFQLLESVEEHSVQMVFADIPYNLTNCKWDKDKWDLELMWALFRRVLKPNGAVVMTATEPFNVDLINSNRKEFKYSWIWQKNLPSGFLNAKKQPLKTHELVLLFYDKLPTYNPQMIPVSGQQKIDVATFTRGGSIYGKVGSYDGSRRRSYQRYPKSVQEFKCVHNQQGKKEGRIRHPTEKPVELVEYMIKTYTNPGDIVLDPCMGTGATMVACQNTGRSGIGFELDQEYFDTSAKRCGFVVLGGE